MITIIVDGKTIEMPDIQAVVDAILDIMYPKEEENV